MGASIAFVTNACSSILFTFGISMGRIDRALAENLITMLLIVIPIALDLVAKGLYMEVGHHFRLDNVLFLDALADLVIVVHPHCSAKHF